MFREEREEAKETLISSQLREEYATKVPALSQLTMADTLTVSSYYVTIVTLLLL